SRRRHTRSDRDWSSDVCSSDLAVLGVEIPPPPRAAGRWPLRQVRPCSGATAWRQLGYHLLAAIGGTLGGALVGACWSAPILALRSEERRVGKEGRSARGAGR